ncbi:MAG: LamG-like jellyroll fold domain-containing protein [Solirubrobacterales bacterium]
MNVGRRCQLAVLVLFAVACVFLSASITMAGGAAVSAAAHGKILDQQLDDQGRGYTVMRLWGSYYEMGYARGELLGDIIIPGVQGMKQFIGAPYEARRSLMASAVWQPDEIEQELDGLVDALAVKAPAAGIDKLDLKVCNALGDVMLACRSHSCWGRYVAAPIRTLSSRRLDMSVPALRGLNHHVLCVYVPSDGSTQWVGLAWPVCITPTTQVNEFGTLVVGQSIPSPGVNLSPGRIPRSVAYRYALTSVVNPDISTHLDDVFAALGSLEIMTGSFLSYYVPEGFGGVMTCNPRPAAPDFYDLRRPQAAWHHGEAMITTNQYTDGTFSPSDQDFGADVYYADESPKTLESHWKLLETSSSTLGLHRLSLAYRGRGDMTIWADGRTEGASRTPRLEYEWSALFDLYDGAYDFNRDGMVDIEDLRILIESWGQNAPSIDIAPAPLGDGVVDRRDLEVLMDHWGQEVIDPALVAHWRLDENQGQIAQDSARDHDGALHGAPVWQPAGGMRDGALQLDGIDDYVSAASALDPAHGSFSVFLWVRGGAPGQVILSQADGANWLMLAPEGALMTELKQAGRSGKPLTSAAVVADGAWHHVALVWDGANRSLYVDDVEVAQDAQTSLPLSLADLNIGASNTFAPGAFWSGLIDDVRIYDRAVVPTGN